MPKNLRLVLITAFLDLLGFGILVPSLPSITEHFGMMSSWTMWTQAIYSFGMFIAGGLVGSLSDIHGRKNMLMVANMLNLSGYILLGISYYLVGIIPTIFAFGLFILSRFIAGCGGSGFGVIQAYVSDISSKEEKTKNMGMIGATFGLAFLVGPMIGGILGSIGGVESIVLLSIVVMLTNTLYIYFKLPEPTRHQIEKKDTDTLKYTNFVLFLFAASLFVTIGFSSIQSSSAQFYNDIFSFDERQIGFAMSVVGLSSIVYQGFLVKYVRKYLSDRQMMLFGIGVLMVFVFLFGINRDPIILYLIVVFLPIGMGSFNPSLSSLLSQSSPGHIGKIMGINASIGGIGGILGPILVGILYAINPTLPYISSSILFAILFLTAIIYLGRETRKSKLL